MASVFRCRGVRSHETAAADIGRSLPNTDTVKTIGIALFDGFALPEIACIMEVFQRANEIARSDQRNSAHFDVCLLSTIGGRIASSSSVFVWTRSLEARQYPDGFHALFVAGGADLNQALHDAELLAWLRRICPITEHVFPVGEGGLLLKAAGCGRYAASESAGDKASYRGSESRITLAPPHGVMPNSLRAALAMIQEELGAHATRQITDLVSPAAPNQFADIVHRNATRKVSENIQASARWLEENGHRQVSIDEAARIAAMSERHFLRRFKAEFGVTPSDYLLYVRLDMSCRLLAETTLPVDKIARRCGIGSGGRLAKLFRKHLGKTPTDYRANHRPAFRPN
ncbi:GlxA family transcriptional regulator [Paraburkholderia sp. 22099]|jgi:transcriptional regulator GlxA family with amidase domain|uniref:GlxA family transcriptional regulator n=1 Tax=Paraburkholderia TaxID=1822464 RepID=UPI001FD0C894|nr:helix-turn-helix domain-containing protein [Paraburkholderia terricola]MDR6494862.1 transcriptional regulator GlxA family with amidase domain [Paraburkholderia terricola]